MCAWAITGWDAYRICHSVVLLSVGTNAYVCVSVTMCLLSAMVPFLIKSRLFGLQSWALFQTCLHLLCTGCQQLNIHSIWAINTHIHTHQHKIVIMKLLRTMYKNNKLRHCSTKSYAFDYESWSSNARHWCSLPPDIDVFRLFQWFRRFTSESIALIKV